MSINRNLDHFSIGHNCSSVWIPINKPTEIKSSFIPSYNLNETRTTIDNAVQVPLFDLSLWGKPKDEVIALLKEFVNQYQDWIEKEQKSSKDSQTNIGKKIIANLDDTLSRLNEGVELLSNDDTLFRAFQFANTSKDFNKISTVLCWVYALFLLDTLGLIGELITTITRIRLPLARESMKMFTQNARIGGPGSIDQTGLDLQANQGSPHELLRPRGLPQGKMRHRRPPQRSEGSASRTGRSPDARPHQIRATKY